MTLLRADLLRDLLFLWHPAQRVLHTCMSVGMDVCGHPSIVHGGFTSGAARRGRAGLAGQAQAAAGERRRAGLCCAAGRHMPCMAAGSASSGHCCRAAATGVRS